MSVAVTPINPKPFLNSIVGEKVIVKLKWGMEYRGIFKSFDAYMNVRLIEAEEWIRGELKGKLGDIFIRCNNVLYIRENTKEKGKAYEEIEEAKKEKGTRESDHDQSQSQSQSQSQDNNDDSDK